MFIIFIPHHVHHNRGALLFKKRFKCAVRPMLRIRSDDYEHNEEHDDEMMMMTMMMNMMMMMMMMMMMNMMKIMIIMMTIRITLPMRLPAYPDGIILMN